MDRLSSFKLFIDNYKNKIIIFFILLIVLSVSLTLVLKIDKVKYQEPEELILETLENDDISSGEQEIYSVDVKGYVNTPGVYSLPKGKRVVDAINIAGGLKDNADTSLLNLSMLLHDQMVIKIYSKDEVANIDKIKNQEEINTNLCQDKINNEACLDNKINDNLSSKIETKEISDKININTSSISTLMTLSKIGEVKAKAIVNYRETNGNFKTIEEIKNVKGIGDSLFETIKNNITV